ELQQQSALEDPGGHLGVPDRAQQDRVVLGQARHVLIGQGLAGAVPASCPEVEVGGLHVDAGRGEGGAQGTHTVRHDLLTDAVTGEYGEAQGGGGRGGGGAHRWFSGSRGAVVAGRRHAQ